MSSEAAVTQQQLTSHRLIEQSLEEMITEMNAKRSRDQTLLQSGSHGFCDVMSVFHYKLHCRFQEGAGHMVYLHTCSY